MGAEAVGQVGQVLRRATDGKTAGRVIVEVRQRKSLKQPHDSK